MSWEMCLGSRPEEDDSAVKDLTWSTNERLSTEIRPAKIERKTWDTRREEKVVPSTMCSSRFHPRTPVPYQSLTHLFDRSFSPLGLYPMTWPIFRWSEEAGRFSIQPTASLICHQKQIWYTPNSMILLIHRGIGAFDLASYPNVHRKTLTWILDGRPR